MERAYRYGNCCNSFNDRIMLRRSSVKLSERLACNGMNGVDKLGGRRRKLEVTSTRTIVILFCLPVAHLVVWSAAIHNSGPMNSMVQYHRIQRKLTVTNWQQNPRPNQISSYRDRDSADRAQFSTRSCRICIVTAASDSFTAALLHFTVIAHMELELSATSSTRSMISNYVYGNSTINNSGLGRKIRHIFSRPCACHCMEVGILGLLTAACLMLLYILAKLGH